MTDWNYYMPTSLRGIANRAKRDPKAKVGNLYKLLNKDNLRECFHQLRKNAASGVDGMTVSAYAENLEGNLEDLVNRLKRKTYRAKLVRRKMIPKDGGKTRPLGIPALEDKLLQLACAKILGAIWEDSFLESNWGYRKGRAAREASCDLRERLQRGRCGWVVEADIQGFFDHLDHDWMERMLRHRITDGALIRLIRKWMKAGVLSEEGNVEYPEAGSPQGGIISPILANIYLHYVLDLWFEWEFGKKGKGQVELIRYADDFVCGFEHEEEARRFLDALKSRLETFGLKLAEEKTRLVRFGRHGGSENGRFDFLGFEFYWTKSREGWPVVKRRTSPKRRQRSQKRCREWIKENRHKRLPVLIRELNRKLEGYWNYYGVIGNFEALNTFHYHMRRSLFFWLNRRSQRRSFTWVRFARMCERLNLSRPRIVERRQEPTLNALNV